MSYYPHIIISYDDLHKKEVQSIIIDDAIKYPDDRAVQYVYKLLDLYPIEVKETKLIICAPELTQFNSDVRDLLYTYDIDYSIDINE